ncbi:MAG TPA: HAD-IC family P-type ATPase, partial [Anaerolineaceae bacterium]
MALKDVVQDYPWHTAAVADAAARAGTDLAAGLTPAEAGTRLSRFGPNRLAAEKKEPFWREFVEELREPMVLMLLVTGVLYAVWGELSDAVTIFIIILALNTVEVVNEQRSKKAIASLRRLAAPAAAVRRGGQIQEIPADQVVPGDVILLRSGRRVPADAHLVEAVGLSLDESALTGESLPVEKSAEPLADAGAPLAERSDMVYSSTLVTRGKGTAVVVATGPSTEIGRIAGLARQVREPRTPLQQLMGELSKTLIWFALGFSALVPLIGIFLAHQSPRQMLLTGLSLAFATIPEELPIIITMVLALGAYRLSKKHAIIKRLQAVETLGSVTAIATDKTGTLTENRMEAARFEPEAMKRPLLELGVVCSDAVPDGAGFSGGPLDAALLRAARAAGLDIEAVRADCPILAEIPFDNIRKRMTVTGLKNGRPWLGVKGAPEAVVPLCGWMDEDGRSRPLDTTSRQGILDRSAAMAAEGLRV